MTVSLSVTQVRQALFLQAGGGAASGDGQATTRLLGNLFHETFQQILSGEGPAAWANVFRDETPRLDRWRARLQSQVYRFAVGPAIDRHAATLHSAAAQVCLFWEAVKNLADWVAELVWTVYESDQRLPQPETLASSEYQLRWLLQQPGWSDEVLLSGAADAVWRAPGRDVWCLAELKLGRTHQLADLGQACLYHAMLEAVEPSQAGPGPLALVSFKPQREEQLFEPDQLHEARAELIELIGTLAGVKNDAPPPTTAAQTPLTTPEAGDSSPSPSHQELGRKLLETLSEYGAPGELAGPPVLGPAFVKFPIRPARAVRVSKITRLASEIRVRLGLEHTPLISCEGGQLGIDIQRADRQFVAFGDIRSHLPPPDPARGCSKVLLGVDIHRQLVCGDLAAPENCHLLVAGTTGSGKSEWLRAAIAGLIASNSPETLQLILIDPKRNAFKDLEQSDYLLRGIVYPDEEPSVEVFRDLVARMDERYRSMGGADCFEAYLAEQGSPLPRIVCFCDEYFDLVNQGKKVRADLEEAVFRLGAKARAAGIHLVLATQQPSREIIRGALDTNLPSRVALKMNKDIESRMLLGESGAEHLLGCGDLLFKDIGPPRRLQGVYVS